MIPGIKAELLGYLDSYPADRGRLTDLLNRIAKNENLSPRSDMAGHATSTILTLDRTRTKALLIHHRASGAWLPPGGHHESGQTLHASGLRELAEETGLEQSRSPGGAPLLIDVDTHPIAARPAKGEGEHYHHDFMYLELCDEDFDPVMQAEEVQGAEWRDLGEIQADGGRMARVVERIRALPSAMLA